MAKQKYPVARFIGGPRDGDSMTVSETPMEYMRLAFPEWCLYRRLGNSFDYEYQGSQQAPNAGVVEW